MGSGPWLALVLATRLASGAAVELDAISNEGTYGSTYRPESNTRVGFFSNELTVSLAIGESWLLEGSYTLSGTQGASLVHTPGLTATHAFDDHWILSIGGLGSPPSRTVIPICVTLPRGATECGGIAEQLWSVGGVALASYDSGRTKPFEWGADAGYAPSLFAFDYRRANALPTAPGLQASLWQHRLSAAVVAHVVKVLDLQLKGGYAFFHGADEAVLQLGLNQLVGGPPIAPRRWEGGGGATVFLLERKLSLHAGALFASYAAQCAGNATLVDVKVTGRPGPVRIWASVLVQLDRPPRDPATQQLCAGRLGQPLTARTGTYGSLGAEYLF